MMTKDELVVNHIPLVHSIAKKLNVPHFKDDLVSEGMIVLVQSAEKFDPNRGNQFGVYARKGIRRAMIRYLNRNTDDAVSIDSRDEDGVPYLETIGRDGQIGIALLKDDLKHYLHPVEEWVIVKRYFDNDSFPNIAAQLGFPESRVSQIHKNALRKLRKVFGPTEVAPQEESDDNQNALLQVVHKMFWDEWGVEVVV